MNTTDAALVAELIDERFGESIPWRELTAKPAAWPPLVVEDDLTKARRRRDLNEAMDDAPPTYRRSYRAA